MNYLPFSDHAEPRKCALLFLASADDDMELDWLVACRRDFPRLEVARKPQDALLNGLGDAVIVIARAEECHTLAQWSLRNPLRARQHVSAALLVAPSKAEDTLVPGTQKPVLPYQSVVVASRNHPAFSYDDMIAQAGRWGSVAIDGGTIGAADADARLGDWGHGRHVLNWLVEQVTHHTPVEMELSSCCVTNVVPLRRKPDNTARSIPQTPR